MRVVKPMRLGVMTRPFETRAGVRLAVAAYVFAPLTAPRRLLNEQGLWKVVADALGGDSVFDEGMPKPRAEFLLAGFAHAPGGVPIPEMRVRAKLGPVEKSLLVSGNRYFEGDRISAPEPMVRMALTHKNAFGGPDFDDNPLGKGIAPQPDDEHGRIALPNLEFPRTPIVSRGDRPRPATFLPRSVAVPERMKKAGTYDKSWLEEVYPGLADDIDWNHFNMADGDQLGPKAWGISEAYCLENVHPARPEWAGTLPGLVVRALLERKGSSTLEPVETHLETVWFFPEFDRLALIYRGVTEIAEDDAHDVESLLLAAEDESLPRELAHYEEALARRKDKDKSAEIAFRDDDLLPAWDLPPSFDLGQLLPEVEAKAFGGRENLLIKNSQRRLMLENEATRKELVAAGIDPGPPVDLPDPADPSYFDKAKLVAEAEHKKIAVLAKEAEEERDKTRAEIRATLAAHGQDPAKFDKADADRVGGPPAYRADVTLAELTGLAATSRALGRPALELESSLQDPATQRALKLAEERMLAAYRASAQYFPAAKEQSEEASLALRATVVAKHAAGESLQGVDLTGARLHELALPGADLREALLERVDLRGANLRGANLSGATLVRANLSDADLSATQLDKTNLADSSLVGSRFNAASLRAGFFHKSTVLGVTLDAASLSQMCFLECTLSGIRFSRAELSECAFIDCVLEDCDFEDAALEKTVFVQCTIRDTKFGGARLTRVTFVEVLGERLNFDGASMPEFVAAKQTRMSGCSFVKATLTAANFRETLLAGALFSDARADRADFSDADLEGASFARARLRGATFVRSRLTKAEFRSADLLDAVMQKAWLHHANLSGASLFAADLARVRLSKETDLSRANLERARTKPVHRGGA